jgi:hypothetical protein
MLKRVATLVGSGVQVIALLALNDEGTPCYDHRNAKALASMGVPTFSCTPDLFMGVPTFSCTPDLFPDLMAAAIARQDLRQWAATQEIAIG